MHCPTSAQFIYPAFFPVCQQESLRSSVFCRIFGLAADFFYLVVPDGSLNGYQGDGYAGETQMSWLIQFHRTEIGAIAQTRIIPSNHPSASVITLGRPAC
jgi:hypothetical protein